jgi:hypothetical protein
MTSPRRSAKAVPTLRYLREAPAETRVEINKPATGS